MNFKKGHHYYSFTLVRTVDGFAPLVSTCVYDDTLIGLDLAERESSRRHTFFHGDERHDFTSLADAASFATDWTGLLNQVAHFSDGRPATASLASECLLSGRFQNTDEWRFDYPPAGGRFLPGRLYYLYSHAPPFVATMLYQGRAALPCASTVCDFREDDCLYQFQEISILGDKCILRGEVLNFGTIDDALRANFDWPGFVHLVNSF